MVKLCDPKDDTTLTLRVNSQKRSLKAVLLLFVENNTASERDTEKVLNPGITKVGVTISGSPNRVYNSGVEALEMWEDAETFFGKGVQSPNHNAVLF